MLFYELSAADSWPLVGAPSYMKFTSPNDLWKQMKSQLISGKISTCPRMENIPVRIPLPPPGDYGSIFKTQKTGFFIKFKEFLASSFSKKFYFIRLISI